MSPVDEDKIDIEESPNKRASARWWLQWIKAAKKKAKECHWDDAKAAYDEYERMSRGLAASRQDKVVTRGYPIWATSCNILESSYYTDVGKVRSKRRFGIDDPLALTMSFITDHAAQFLIENGNLKETMFAGKRDYVQAGKATTQVLHTADIEPVRVPLSLVGDVYYEDGGEDPYEGEVETDEDGGAYYEKDVVRPESQRIFCAPVLYDEVLHTPDAKTSEEITEMAYKFTLDYDEAEKKFNRNPDGTSKKLNLPYKTGSDYEDADDKASDYEANDSPGRYLTGWECYCKHTKMVYWVCEDYKDGFLGKEKDPYGLKGFFPSPKFIIQNKHRKSLFCTPTYVYLEAFVNQLHTLYYRIYRLVDSIRRRAVVYGLSPELLAALNNVDGEEFISMSDVQEILTNGGLGNYILWIPVKELVDSLSEALKIEEHFKQTFYEHFRLPDILRGVSDPNETLGAQELKTDNANDSFKYDKKQLINLACETAEMMYDLALKVWPDETFARVCGLEFAAPEHQERFAEALFRLRNDEERVVRIEFETDSTNFRDEAKEIQRQNLIAKTLTDGLAMIGRIENPAFMGIAIQTLLEVLNSIGGSTQSENSVKSVVKALEEARNQPPPPPPPDYEQMKLQIMAQKNEVAANKDQMKAFADARELGQEDFRLKLEAQSQQFEQSMAAAKMNFEQMLEASKQSFKEKIQSMQAGLDQALVIIEKQRVDIEEAKAQVQATETMLEEVRLRKDSDIEMATRVAEILAAQTPKPEEKVQPAPVQPPPNITIINGTGKKKHKFNRDASGNILGIDSEEIQ